MTDRLIWAHGAQARARISSIKVSEGQRAGASFNSPRVVRREAGITSARGKIPLLEYAARLPNLRG